MGQTTGRHTNKIFSDRAQATKEKTRINGPKNVEDTIKEGDERPLRI